MQRLDIGREYFEGNIDEMMDKIYHIRNQYSNLSKEEIDKINVELKSYNKKSSKIDRLEDELRKELGDDYEDIINGNYFLK